MRGDEGPVSQARICPALTSERWTEVHRNASRSADAFCQSRQILKPAGADISANFFCDRGKTAALAKVGVDLAIPYAIFSLTDECGKLSEFLGRKRIHSILYFCEAHTAYFSDQRPENNDAR